MKYLVTGREMQLLDKNTWEHFEVPAVVLMEQAAMVFVRKLLLSVPQYAKILVVSGLGNNGADGIAIARLLNQKGIHTDLYTLKEAFPEKCGSELFELQLKIYRNYNFPEIHIIPDSYGKEEKRYDIVIDAIFGIGLTRPVMGAYADLICKMNCLQAKRIAVDIASGINADDGQVMGCAVRCDETITFSFAKTGHYLWPGNEYTGVLTVMDMGITADSFLDLKPSVCAYETDDLPGLLPKRKAHSNKGSYGKLLVIAGGPGMAGAAVFSAKAAYRTGVGLVTVFTHEINRLAIQCQLPEAVVATWSESDEPAENQKKLQNLMEQSDAIVIGPGLGTGDLQRHLLQMVLSQNRIPVTADADALNILSVIHIDPCCRLVITPHLGEMSRLTGKKVSQLQAGLIEAARSYAKQHQLTCVLKDFHTVTAGADGRIWLNLSGNNGMATGGSGDVLSGIIGALLAAGLKDEEAASAGVFLHGRSGDLICMKTGEYSLMASDIIDGLLLASAKH